MPNAFGVISNECRTMKLSLLSVVAAAILMAAPVTTTPAWAAPAAAQTAKVDLPRVAILATGGTIASRGSSSLSLTDYGVGSGHKPVGVEVLVDAVPEIKNFAQISGEQVFNVGSSKLSIDNWLTLANRINELLATPSVDGIVVTHGTDTLEETAYFLNLVVKSDKPVVLVGSMRPATGLSADGPLNLVNAVALAGSRDAQGRGVMVVMNDQISSAFNVTKRNSTNVATFRCPDTGFLGYMQNNKPYFFNTVNKRHTTKSEFSIKGLKTLPRVDVHYTTLGEDGKVVDAMVKIGAKGIVNAGLGHANVPNAVMDSLIAAQKAGTVVVVGSRVGTGLITPLNKFSKHGFVSAMMHTPQKARILLMLALTKTNDPKEIQRIFDEY